MAGIFNPASSSLCPSRHRTSFPRKMMTNAVAISIHFSMSRCLEYIDMLPNGTHALELIMPHEEFTYISLCSSFVLALFGWTQDVFYLLVLRRHFIENNTKSCPRSSGQTPRGIKHSGTYLKPADIAVLLYLIVHFILL